VLDSQDKPDTEEAESLAGIPSVTVTANNVEIRRLSVTSREVMALLFQTPPDLWEAVATSAIDIGARCLLLAGDARDVEGLRRQLETAVRDVEDAFRGVTEAVQEELTARLSSEDGQVLAPVCTMIREASAVSTARVAEVRALLTEELDPERESSKLGSALKVLGELLDPQRKDSVQARMEAAVQGVCSSDGALVETVRKAVTEVTGPLAAEIDKLALELRGRQAAQEIVSNTTAKGAPYEERVVAELQFWAAAIGAEVHHEGTDNQPGDVLVKLSRGSDPPTVIVVEARDRSSSMGRKAIGAALAKALAHREADAALYVSATREGLAKEIGDWAEGEIEGGPFVATTQDHLITAVRFLAAETQLMARRPERAEVDTSAVEGELGRIRAALGRIATMHRKLTEIRGAAESVEECASGLRDEVRASLVSIEDALRIPH